MDRVFGWLRRHRSVVKKDNFTGPDTEFESGGGAVSRVGTHQWLSGQVMFDGDDDGHWTAMGWWLEYRGGDFIASAPHWPEGRPAYLNAAQAVAVFADGSEFRRQPDSFPQSGIGRYRGTISGPTSWYGDSSQFAGGIGAEGDGLAWFAGEFTASIDMQMNYPARNIHGIADLVSHVRVKSVDGVWGDFRNFVDPLESGNDAYLIGDAKAEFGESGGPAWRVEGALEGDGSFSSHVYGVLDGLNTASGFKSSATGGATMVGVVSSVKASNGHPRSVTGIFWGDVDFVPYTDTHKAIFIAPFLMPMAE